MCISILLDRIHSLRPYYESENLRLGLNLKLQSCVCAFHLVLDTSSTSRDLLALQVYNIIYIIHYTPSKLSFIYFNISGPINHILNQNQDPHFDYFPVYSEY